MNTHRARSWLPVAATLLGAAAAAGDGLVVRVANDRELRLALGRLQPGTTVSIAPGTYRGGLYVRGAAGRAGSPVAIQGRDPNDPPVFRKGPVAMHLSDCSHVVLRRFVADGFTAGGVNIDDGGTVRTPAHHVTLEDVAILRTGPRGNRDALKMSGVDHFTVRRCRFEGWGGSAIDMVGCHHGVIEDCRFVGRRGFSQSNAVQTKGGSADILVQTSYFERAGQRAINLGGSTGLAYFRPRVGDCEASDITVAGNRFVGGMAPVAWVTARGGHVHHNTIYRPERWVLRILQEQPVGRFVSCRGGVFENNLVVYDRRVGEIVNVGPHTAPATFTFRRNAWYCPGATRRPALPASETGGVYHVDPKLRDAGTAKMAVTSKDARLKGIGADGYKPAKGKP